MIRITDLILPFDHSESDLESAIRRVLEIKPEELKSIKIIKSSLDARKKHKIRRVFTVQVETTGEKEILDRHAKNQQVKKAEVAVYASPVLIRKTGTHRPLIIGTGPAGLFAGLILAEAGLGPLILERGKPVKERTQDTFQFW